MNKKFWTGFVAVFVAMEIMMFLIHGVILKSAYEATQSVWRPDMMSLMWIYHVLAIIGAFFLTFSRSTFLGTSPWLTTKTLM